MEAILPELEGLSLHPLEVGFNSTYLLDMLAELVDLFQINYTGAEPTRPRIHPDGGEPARPPRRSSAAPPGPAWRA